MHWVRVTSHWKEQDQLVAPLIEGIIFNFILTLLFNYIYYSIIVYLDGLVHISLEIKALMKDNLLRVTKTNRMQILYCLLIVKLLRF